MPRGCGCGSPSACATPVTKARRPRSTRHRSWQFNLCSPATSLAPTGTPSRPFAHGCTAAWHVGFQSPAMAFDLRCYGGPVAVMLPVRCQNSRRPSDLGLLFSALVLFRLLYLLMACGFQNSAIGLDLGFYATRSYSLMRPPRRDRRWIRFLERSAGGWSGRGGRSWRLRWGRRPCSGPRTRPGSSACAVRRRSASGR